MRVVACRTYWKTICHTTMHVCRLLCHMKSLNDWEWISKRSVLVGQCVLVKTDLSFVSVVESTSWSNVSEINLFPPCSWCVQPYNIAFWLVAYLPNVSKITTKVGYFLLQKYYKRKTIGTPVVGLGQLTAFSLQTTCPKQHHDNEIRVVFDCECDYFKMSSTNFRCVLIGLRRGLRATTVGINCVWTLPEIRHDLNGERCALISSQ